MIKQLAVCSALAAGLLAPNLVQAGTPVSSQGRHLSLLGFDVCVGEVADGTTCDAHIERAPPDPGAQRQTMAMSFELMDRRICVGDVPSTDGCWLHVPYPDEANSTLAARERAAPSDQES